MSIVIFAWANLTNGLRKHYIWQRFDLPLYFLCLKSIFEKTINA